MKLIFFSLVLVLVLLFESFEGSTNTKKKSSKKNHHNSRHLPTESVGIDDLQIHELVDPAVINLVNAETIISSLSPSLNSKKATNFFNDIESEVAQVERYPRDLLADKDPEYLEYLRANRKKEKVVTDLVSLIEKKKDNTYTNSNKLEKCLTFEDSNVTEKQVVQMIESSPHVGSTLKCFNGLPQLYLRKRKLPAFTAFMRRFRYQKEFSINSDTAGMNLNNLNLNSSTDIKQEQPTGVIGTTPFFALMISILKSVTGRQTCDEKDKLFMQVILETQQEVLTSEETVYIDGFLRSGPAAFPFLQQYFAIVESNSKSANLVMVLTSVSYEEIRSPELMQKILDLPNFDVNVRVPFWNLEELKSIGFDEITNEIAFFHVVIIEQSCSTTLLSTLLKDPKLDIMAPTGDCIVTYESGLSVHYKDYHPLFLAIMTLNSCAMLQLGMDDRFTPGILWIYFQCFIHWINTIMLKILKDLKKWMKL